MSMLSHIIFVSLLHLPKYAYQGLKLYPYSILNTRVTQYFFANLLDTQYSSKQKRIILIQLTFTQYLILELLNLFWKNYSILNTRVRKNGSSFNPCSEQCFGIIVDAALLGTFNTSSLRIVTFEINFLESTKYRGVSRKLLSVSEV